MRSFRSLKSILMQTKVMNYRENFEKWLESPMLTAEEKAELSSLSEKEIEDRFYRDLSFGTGGLRGVMAVGANRMNLFIVRRAAEGVARELLASGSAISDRGVVIGYDSRNLSADFARASAEVLSSFGIKCYLFDSLCPTPEVSFAVRHLGCARGIVITASHNPKEYNGFKVYDEEGTQIAPTLADRILSFIRSVPLPSCSYGAIRADLIHSVGDGVHAAYRESVLAERLGVKLPSDMRILYTPLHGAGNLSVRAVLSAIGAHVAVVSEQELPNGDFPTVKSPNPENPEAFDLAIEYAKKHPVDLILGTDPDSDRLGLVVPEKDGSFTLLNGNQTGVLLAELILRKTKEKGMPAHPHIVKTVVTTELVRRIADAYGVQTEDVLTGFKYIGDKIKEYEAEGKTFLFGLEESYGYLKGTYARDKDAVVAAMLAAELCADCKAEGVSVSERLRAIYERYGYSKERLLSFTFKGIEGSERILSIMKALRASGALDKEKKRIDFLSGVDGLPSSDVMKFILEDGWIAVRPSGTEPKIKFYLAADGKTEAECDARLDALSAWVNALINS